jgi:hypothetical protein
MRTSQLPRGVTELEVEANNFRRLILQLDRRFPGLGHQIDEGMAVAIDGESPRMPTSPRSSQKARSLSDPEDLRRWTSDATLGSDHSSSTPSWRRPAK